MLERPAHEGYSPSARAARASVLQAAADTLLTATLRRDYDDRRRMGDMAEEVPADYVAGVLVLLQEAGEPQTVVAAGEHWLATHRSSPRAKDVALAVALSHCAIARSLLSSTGNTQQATRMLEVCVLGGARGGGGQRDGWGRKACSWSCMEGEGVLTHCVAGATYPPHTAHIRSLHPSPTNNTHTHTHTHARAQVAATLLRQYRTARELEGEVRGLIGELQPALALELLGADLAEPERRQKVWARH